MTRRKRRFYMVMASGAALALATTLVLLAIGENASLFYTPSDAKARQVPPGRRINLGGLVKAGSVIRDGTKVSFTITDGVGAAAVTYEGMLPDLFREGQGVVTTGSFDPQGVFRATIVLAKHDETYMPPEVAKALKEKGVWKHTEKAPGPPQPSGSGDRPQ